MKKFLFLAFCMLMLSARLPAQNTATATLSAAASTCATTNVCLALPINPNVGGVTFTVSANASSNTIQFEATANGGATWVALNATPSNSATAASSTTSTGTWQANVAGYTSVRVRMSSLVSGTTTVTLSTSTASARAGGGGGGGTVTGSGASPQVAFWSSPSALTGSSTFTNGDGTNALQVFQGPPTSGFSSNITPIAAAGIPTAQTNFHSNSGSGIAAAVGSMNFTQTDTDIETFGREIATDATDCISCVSVGEEVDSYYNVPISDTNVSVQTGFEAAVTAYGAGDSAGHAAFYGATSNKGAGTVAFAANFESTVNNVLGAGPVTNGYGFYALDLGGTASSLNAAFRADAQKAGANNFGFYSDLTNKDRFGSIYQTALIFSTTAPSVATSGCGTTGASIVSNNGTAAFKVNVGTTNSGTCTITMPTARTDWLCSATDITTTSTTVSQTKSVPGGTPATQIVLQNYTDISGTHAWVDNDVIAVTCGGE